MASISGYDYLDKTLPLTPFSILCVFVCMQSNYREDHLFSFEYNLHAQGTELMNDKKKVHKMKNCKNFHCWLNLLWKKIVKEEKKQEELSTCCRTSWTKDPGSSPTEIDRERIAQFNEKPNYFWHRKEKQGKTTTRKAEKVKKKKRLENASYCLVWFFFLVSDSNGTSKVLENSGFSGKKKKDVACGCRTILFRAFSATPNPADQICKVDAAKEGKSLCFFTFLSQPGHLEQPPSLCKIQLWVHSELDQPKELKEKLQGLTGSFCVSK